MRSSDILKLNVTFNRLDSSIDRRTQTTSINTSWCSSASSYVQLQCGVNVSLTGANRGMTIDLYKLVLSSAQILL